MILTQNIKRRQEK